MRAALAIVKPSRKAPLPVRELIDRLTFAVRHPYAHNVITIGKQTAEAILRHLEGEAPMNTHTIPTPDEIDAVIFDMIAAEAARAPDGTSLDDMWSSVALDRHGEFRGYGFGHTTTEARAGAWITVWWPECDLRAVPRVVPEGWTFELYSPGEGPVFRRKK